MKRLLFLVIFSFCSPGYTEDFINMKTRKVWRVQECISSDGSYTVKTCFSSEACPKKYPQAVYTCENGPGCGQSFLNQLPLRFADEKDVYVRKVNSHFEVRLMGNRQPFLLYYRSEGKAPEEITKELQLGTKDVFALVPNASGYSMNVISAKKPTSATIEVVMKALAGCPDS